MKLYIYQCLIFAVAIFAVAASGRPAFASDDLSGDAQRGQALFRAQCGICHESGKMFKAPRLGGLFGRVAGDLPWPYSDIFRQADFVWTEDILDAYLEFPREMMPGNNMAFYGIDSAADRRNLIAYIKTLSAAQ